MKRKNILFQCGLLALTLLVFGGYLTVRHSRLDLTGPEISIEEGVLELSVSDDRELYFQGVTAQDDRDGDVTDLIILESVYGVTADQQVTVTYAAFDRSGNVTKATRQIRFTDYHGPRFSLKRALAFPENSGIDVMDYIGAEDIFDGDVVRWIRATLISSPGTLTDVGIHDVQLQVTNSLGDTAELVLPVEVYPPEKYNARMELETYLVYLPVGATFDARSYPVAMTCDGVRYSLRVKQEDITVTASGDVDTRTPGVYPVTYTARCAGNGITYTAYSRMFVVVEE